MALPLQLSVLGIKASWTPCPLSMLEHAHRVVHLAHPDMPCTCNAFVPRAWAKTGQQFSLSAGYSMYRLAIVLCILHLASAADHSAHRWKRQADPPTTLPVLSHSTARMLRS